MAGRQEEAVSVLLAGLSGRVEDWYQDLVRDARFRVLSYATSVEELAQRASMGPEVLLLDAALLAGPQPLLDALAGLPLVASYVFLPAGTTQGAEAAVAGS